MNQHLDWWLTLTEDKHDDANPVFSFDGAATEPCRRYDYAAQALPLPIAALTGKQFPLTAAKIQGTKKIDGTTYLRHPGAA